jgi:MFS family permease
VTTETESQPRVANPFGRRTVAPLVMGSALNPINSSVIATALVPIAAALHVPVGRTSILVSSLYLACAIAQPTAGKLAEEFGPRRVFLAGIVVVLAGGLVGGLGNDLAVLVVARVLIGVGTSCGYPSAMVIIRRRSHQAGLTEPPGSVLGSLAIAGSATVAIGPPIGGLLVGGLGWRSAFLLNVPLTAAALAMTLAWVPRDAQPTARRKIAEVATRIDLGGIALFGGMLAALLVFLMSLPHPGWMALAISAVLAALLVAWELRAARPFIDLRLLASQRALTRTYLRFGLTLLGVYIVLYGITQWMEAARGLSPEQAGLVLLPMGAVAALVSQPVSRRNLVRGPLVACGFFMLLASAATLFITGHSPVVALVGVMILFGVVVGTTSVGNQTALYLQAPPEDLGTASGLSRTFGYIGSIASATITSIVFRTRVSDAGLHDMALILVGVAAAVLLLTLLDRQLPRGSKP